MHSCKSHLFGNTCVWIKREGDPGFDVTMVSFDDAEICEVAGMYILNILSEKCSKKGWVSADNSIVCFEKISQPLAETIRKDIKIFKQELNLNIAGETNLKIVIFFRYNLKPLKGKITTL